MDDVRINEPPLSKLLALGCTRVFRDYLNLHWLSGRDHENDARYTLDKFNGTVPPKTSSLLLVFRGLEGVCSGSGAGFVRLRRVI